MHSNLSCRYFTYLSVHGDKTRYNILLASAEASQCQDLLSQAQYHVSRARRIDEEERNLRTKQEQERAAFKKRQEEEREMEVERRRKAGEEMLVKRSEYIEKTKNALLFDAMPSEKKRGPGRGRRDEYVSDSGSDAGAKRADGEAGNEKPRKKSGKGGRKKREKRTKRDHSGSDSDGAREKRGRKKGSKQKTKAAKSKAQEGLSHKQKMRIVSKATISTSESDSEKMEVSSNASGSDRKSRSRSRSGKYFSKITMH